MPHTEHDFVQLKQVEIKEVREKLYKQQEGICPICKHTIKDPCLDHNHKTGAIRAVLCRNCNRVEGKVSHWVNTVPGDDASILENISKFWVQHIANVHGLLHPGRKPKKKSRKTKSKRKTK